MSSAWLTPQQRIDDEWSGRALEHAELADQIIHELATALRKLTNMDCCINGGDWCCEKSAGAYEESLAVLSVVDALGGHDE